MSSNTKVASVGKKSGRVTVKKAGTATITARVGKKSYKCKVTVTEGDYKKLYREFLAANRRSIGKFYVLNVDKKGCPELITIPMGLGGAIIHYDVYTVKSNKVVLAGSYAAKGMGLPSIILQSQRDCMPLDGRILLAVRGGTCLEFPSISWYRRIICVRHRIQNTFITPERRIR